MLEIKNEGEMEELLIGSGSKNPKYQKE